MVCSVSVLIPQHLQTQQQLAFCPTSLVHTVAASSCNSHTINLSCVRACVQALVALSRLGVYIRLPGVDVARFEQSMQGGGLLGYIDTLSGGSVSKVGVFSLGTTAHWSLLY